MIRSRRNGLERHKLLERLDQLIVWHVSLAIASRIATCDIPNRHRIVIRSCDVELLPVESRERRCQDPSLMGLPAIDTLVLLAEGC